MLKQIEQRRSIRAYLDKAVDDRILVTLLESARLAPSGSNTQPWHFIIIKDSEIRKQIAKVSHDQKWILSAPIFIACVADIRVRTEVDGLDLDAVSPEFELKQIIRDTSIAVEHMVLEATEQGLGTCWVAWFKQEEIRPILGIPHDKYLVSIITVGYPDESPKARSRKELNELIHYEKW